LRVGRRITDNQVVNRSYIAFFLLLVTAAFGYGQSYVYKDYVVLPWMYQLTFEEGSEHVELIEFTIVNNGPFNEQFTVYQYSNWIVPLEDSVFVRVGERRSIYVMVATPPVRAPYQVLGAFYVQAQGGRLAGGYVWATMVPNSGTTIRADPEKVKFEFDSAGQGAVTRTVQIHYSGDSVDYTVLGGNKWLKVAPQAGILTSAAPVAMTLTVDPRFLNEAKQTTYVLVRASFRRTLVITVEAETKDPQPPFDVWPPALTFFQPPGGEAPMPQSFRVTSADGAETFGLLTRAADTWLQVKTENPSTPAVAGVSVAAGAAPASTTVEVLRASDQKVVGRVTVETRGWPAAPLVIPHFAAGEGFASEILLTNAEAGAAQARLRFRRALPDGSGGAEAWNPWTGGAEEHTVLVPGRGSARVAMPAAVKLTTGWVQLDAPAGVRALVLFRRDVGDGKVQEVSVAASRALQRRILMAIDQREGFDTGFAVANAHGSEAAGVEAVFRDAAGREVMRSALGPIPALGYRTFVMSQVFPELAGRRGTLEIWSGTGDPRFTALRFHQSGAMTAFDPEPLHRERPATLVLPHVADGGGFSTSVTFVNRGSTAAEVRWQFRRMNAEGAAVEWRPFLLNVDGPVLRLEPGAAHTIQTRGEGELPASGWASFSVTGSVGGFAVFQRATGEGQIQEAAIPLGVAAGEAWMVPFDHTGGRVSGLALTNPSGAAAVTVDYVLRDEAGVELKRGTVVDLAREGHTAFVLPEKIPETAGRKGVLELIPRNGAVSSIGLLFLPTGAFTSLDTLGGAR